MNSLETSEATVSETPAAETAGAGIEPDDEFENEELGERQAEACSMDEDCTGCQ